MKYNCCREEENTASGELETNMEIATERTGNRINSGLA